MRVGVLSVFYGAYDDVMGSGFRQLQLQAAVENRAVLERYFQVTDFGVMSSLEQAQGLRSIIAASDIETLVFAPAMVAPPQWAEVALADARCPTVIWNATRIREIAADLDHLAATVNTSLVGATMLANCLVRRAQPFVVVDTALADVAGEQRLRRVVTAAVASYRLKSAIALRVGTPIAGYSDVETTTQELGALGIREVQVSPEELLGVYAGVSAREAQLELAALTARPTWTWSDAAASESSVRLAIALRKLAMDHKATLGTVNCHGCWFRQHPKIGIVACLGVSLLHEAGIPFSCTGDLPAAMAGLLSKTLSGSALYCELYVHEPDSDEFLVAAGGEGDPSWADNARVEVVLNQYYPGMAGAGAGLRFALQPGAATLISMTPSASGWRLIWGLGEITGRSFARLDGPNGMFRFQTQPGRIAAEQWIAAGPTHHPSLARRHLDLELEVVAKLAQLTSCRV
jgi:L-arabinose isomerase